MAAVPCDRDAVSDLALHFLAKMKLMVAAVVAVFEEWLLCRVTGTQ